MASAPRVEFSPALSTAMVETESALLTSERPASRQADALSVEAAWAHMDCTSYARQTRAAPTLALVKALLIAHDDAPDPVFWPNPEEELTGRNRGKQRRSDRCDSGDHTRGAVRMVASGVAANMVGVATTTTAAGVTAVVEAGEAHQVLVWLRVPPRGQLWSQQPWQWPQLWRRKRRAEERRERTFSVGRLVNLLPLVLGLEHGPRRGDRGSRQKVSKSHGRRSIWA